MKKQVLVLGLMTSAFMGSVSWAQKATETSAVLAFREYGNSIAKGDMAAAKSSLLKAKELIDQAAAHPDTENSPKTLFHKGEIYTSFISLSMVSGDPELAKSVGENGFMDALAAYKKGYTTSDKYDSEIKESIMTKKIEMDAVTNMLYSANQFKEAMGTYEMQIQMSDVIGEVDTLSTLNAGICADKAGLNEAAAMYYAKCARMGYKAPATFSMAAGSYSKAGKTAEAKAVIQEGRQKFPNDRDLINEMVNISMMSGDKDAAEKSLNDAIALDPNNKLLYYIAGTIYIEMSKNELAEQSLNKALAIDPNYGDALYQLGAHYVGLASGVREKANQLKFGDPNYDKMIAESDAYYTKAITPLEKYIVGNPNDKDVLTILAQIFRALKNPDKAKEYKTRADAIK